MHRYSASARRLLAQPVRWNSTIEALPESTKQSSKEVVDPPAATPGVPHQTPRRFLPLSAIDDGAPYRPDFDAIAARAAQGSLTKRLAFAAAQKKETELGTSPAEAPAPTISNEQHQQIIMARRAENMARETQSAEDAVARRREAIQARRAERLVREATLGGAARGAAPGLRGARGGAARGSAASQSRSAQPGSKSSGDGRTPPVSVGRTPPAIVGGRAAPGRSGTQMRGKGRGGRGGAAKGGGPGRLRKDRLDGAPTSDSFDDLDPDVAEWLGVDDVKDRKLRASSLAADIPADDLNEALVPQIDSFTRKPRAMREVVGGDYSRFIPGNPQLFLASARKVGPVNHSSAILTRSKQVLVDDRARIKDVVRTSTTSLDPKA
ncbi:hypothetical protein DFH06DRAFT_1207577 [Mycena polygramma]|nr:hypothetical protein DFH06DRAFT_1207577 [Mycena polygramma]